MVFTQEDYKRIEQYLQSNSIKDTEFEPALPSLSGNEQVAIIQQGRNRRAFIRDIVNLFTSPDFVNVTDKYGIANATLYEAVTGVPEMNRKEGQIITFLNESGKWIIYLFIGDITQWNNLSLWKEFGESGSQIPTFSLEPYDKDFTKTEPDPSGVIKFKLADRVNIPNTQSGMGYVILRENYVEVEVPGHGKHVTNLLYTGMLEQDNCIYEIRYDFDLNGQRLVIPNNCILKFNGGRLLTGTIVLNNTELMLDRNIITDDITSLIEGNFKEGQVLYDISSKKLKLWNGEAWVNTDGTPL